MWKTDGTNCSHKQHKKNSPNSKVSKFDHGVHDHDDPAHQTLEDCSNPVDYTCRLDNNALYKQRVQFGDKALPIHTWGVRVCVDALKPILGSGTMLHLMNNRRVRDLIEARRILT